MIPPQSNPVRAAFWMLGAMVSFTSMAVAGREIAYQLDTFELMTYRSLIGIVVVLTVGGFSRTLGQINTRDLPLHAIRNASHFAGQNLWFFAVTLIPFAQLFAFEFSTPIWVALFAPLVLKEKLTGTRLFAALLGFIGILIVARPEVSGLNVGVIAAIVAAFGFTGAVLATKILTRTHSVTNILFWLTFMQAVFGLTLAGYDGDIALPTAATWPLVIVVGFAGLFAHLCITRALTLAPAIIVSPMDFGRLPMIALIGMFFYAEPLEWQIILGALIVLGANLLNINAERRLATVPPL